MSPPEGAWLWLFRFPYLVHILEESFAGRDLESPRLRRRLRREPAPL
jgi:hypothetical protein